MVFTRRQLLNQIYTTRQVLILVIDCNILEIEENFNCKKIVLTHSIPKN